MNHEKVIFSFFIVLALTLNFGFVIGDIDKPEHHSVYSLFFAIIINLAATILKFGDRSQLGAMLLATSLVADLQLLAAAIIWGLAEHVFAVGLSPLILATVVELSAGALVANVISVILLLIETTLLHR